MSQSEHILAALLLGEKITPLDAFRRWGVLAMHSRAAELRSRGVDVKCRVVRENGKRWGEYSL